MAVNWGGILAGGLAGAGAGAAALGMQQLKKNDELDLKREMVAMEEQKAIAAEKRAQVARLGEEQRIGQAITGARTSAANANAARDLPLMTEAISKSSERANNYPPSPKLGDNSVAISEATDRYNAANKPSAGDVAGILRGQGMLKEADSLQSAQSNEDANTRAGQALDLQVSTHADNKKLAQEKFAWDKKIQGMSQSQKNEELSRTRAQYKAGSDYVLAGDDKAKKQAALASFVSAGGKKSDLEDKPDDTIKSISTAMTALTLTGDMEGVNALGKELQNRVTTKTQKTEPQQVTYKGVPIGTARTQEEAQALVEAYKKANR